MNVELVSESSRLAALEGPWNALAANSPLLSWEWMSLWWKHYGRPAATQGRASLYVLAAWDGDSLVGVAPWYAELGRLGRRKLRFLGSGEVCTDYLTIMAAPGRDAEVVQAVADFLLPNRSRPSSGPANWHSLDFDGIDATDGAMALLGKALTDRGALLYERPGMRTWRLALPDNWETFVTSFSKTRRKQMRQWMHDIETGRIAMHVARTPADLARGWPILIDLHQRRRRSLGDPGCFASPRFGAFHAEVAAALLESGRLQLTWIERNGKPLASEYMLMGGGVAYCYQSGIEPLETELQPGHLAVMATVANAIENGCTGYDFMRGEEPYKARWHAEPRPAIRLRAWPGRTVDVVHREACKQYEAAKALVKRHRETRAAQAAANQATTKTAAAETPEPATSAPPVPVPPDRELHAV
jgi:CelD/BcsL family acetyltransferase involved in cellulose biosynthesis